MWVPLKILQVMCSVDVGGIDGGGTTYWLLLPDWGLLLSEYSLQPAAQIW